MSLSKPEVIRTVGRWIALVFTGVFPAIALSQSGPVARRAADSQFTPMSLSLQPAVPESVYAPPAAPRPNEGINKGAVHFGLDVGYVTDYLYRGIELSELPEFNSDPLNPGTILPSGAEDSLNLQVQFEMHWDLGSLPHPFVGVFVNYYDADPISTFQEVRPFFGLEWTIRPLILTAGHNSYLYPDRDAFETSEVYGKIEIDDSYFLSSDQKLLSPYIYGAYDYDRYNGWYIEAGVSHDFLLRELGLTLTADAHVAYVRGIELYNLAPGQDKANGFQHYQLGLIATYSLNELFDFSTRYGDWSVQGFGYYTDGLNNEVRADTQLWGGARIVFRY